MTHIKICGITTPGDADLAIQAGATFIGLIFAPQSPRCITVPQARQIREQIGERAQVVGVFQNQAAEAIQHISTQLNLDLIQLHGQETPDFCQAMPRPVIKMLPTTDEAQTQVNNLIQPDSNIQYVLFEPPKASGQAITEEAGFLKWLRSSKIALPYFLAGKLSPDNIGPLVTAYRPFGVDVAGGVESVPGVKDPQKVRQFCQAVQLATVSEGVYG